MAALHDADGEQGDAGGGQDGAGEVEALGAAGWAVVAGDPEQDARDDEGADGDVDEEDPAPAGADGEQAAEDEAEDVADASAQQQEAAEGDQVAVDDPAQPGFGEAEFAFDRGAGRRS
ncbi:hypothetical protein [Nonomuraea salmonea]|uniref:hypothetical protein n=1 Tax=Nonomuraea salmonea TaxID=46181 RepID=UPI002FE856AC